MLSSISDRDKDQVVSRWAKREWRRVREGLGQHRRETTVQHNILMVDQLWLWLIPGPTYSDPDTIITSFPVRTRVQVPLSVSMEETSAEVDDLQAAVLRRENLHPRDDIRDTDGLVSRILTVCCRTLDRHQQINTVKFYKCFRVQLGRL